MLFKSAVPDVVFHYTDDGTEPTDASKEGSATVPVIIRQLGTVTVKCFASREGMLDSDVATRIYHIVGRARAPTISPNYGTYERSVNVTLWSSSLTAKVCYNLDSSEDLSRNATCVDSGFVVHISTPGKHVIKAIAVDDNMADSVEADATFHILDQVVAPVVTPDASVFPIVAMLTVRCGTPEATIYYTLDGSDPSESSYTVISGESIVVDTIGPHVLKVYAVAPSMVASRIVRKLFDIQLRMGEPQLLPPPGTYTGDIRLVFACPMKSGGSEGDVSSGRVYYTTDGVRTPSEQHSDSVPCGGSIPLLSPSATVVRAIAVGANKVASGVAQGTYVLVRPAYEEHPVNPAGLLSFSVQPQVDIVVVEKNIAEARVYCSQRNIRGRLIVLRNPVGHFDVVPPLRGCGGGVLELPSVSGRHFQPPDGFNLTNFIGEKIDRKRSHQPSLRRNLRKEFVASVTTQESAESESPSELRLPLDPAAASDQMPPYLQKLFDEENGSIRVSRLQELGEQYEQVRDLGCQVVSNAGFFNVTSNACLGDLVSAGEVHQLSDLHNVNFGVRNGSFVVGYVEKEEIIDPQRPAFDFLISGLGWLVRNGKSYVKESFSAQGDAESMKPQATGPQFVTVHSARTALGHDKHGNLLLLQVEGETWVRGMTLYEFADFAVELGFHSAINLDGGDSATLTQNHSLISEPAWRCTDFPFNSSAYYKCEKPVSSITCIHAAAPPFVAPSVIDRFVHPRSAPTVTPTASPSAAATAQPTTVADDDQNQPPTSTSVNATSAESQLLALRSSAQYYRVSAFTLLVVLILSLCAHVATFVYFCDTSSIVKQSNSFSGTAKNSTRDQMVAVHEVQMVPAPPLAVSSPTSAPPAPPSQGISSQYAAIPANKAAPSASIMSYLPSLTGGRKRLGDTPPEPSARGPSSSPRSPAHKSVVEDELQDISDWRPPNNLLLAHSAAAKPSAGSLFDRSASAAAATAEEEDFYRDEEDDGEDCTDSSRLLQAPSRVPDSRGAPSKSHARAAKRNDSDSSDDGAVQKRVGLKVPKSGKR